MSISANNSAALIGGAVVLNKIKINNSKGETMQTYIVQDKKNFLQDDKKAKRTQVRIKGEPYPAGHKIQLDPDEQATKELLGAKWIKLEGDKVPVELPTEKKK